MKAPRVVRALNIMAILLAGFLLAASHAASDQSANATKDWGIEPYAELWPDPSIFPKRFGEGEPNGPNTGWRGTVGYGTGQLPPLDGQRAPAEEDATALTQQVKELEEQGRYLEAIPLAQRALAIQEATLGPDHREVASALYYLAEAYHKLGR